MRGEPEYQDKNLLNRGGLRSNYNLNPLNSITTKIQTQATPLGMSALITALPFRLSYLLWWMKIIIIYYTVPRPLSLNLPSHQHQT